MTTEAKLVTTIRDEAGLISDSQGHSTPVRFTVILQKDVIGGNPGHESGRGVLQFEKDVALHISVLLARRETVTLIGAGIQVDVLLETPNTFCTVGKSLDRQLPIFGLQNAG
jgi:hypothetical protein